jgi:hypothetical protein
MPLLQVTFDSGPNPMGVTGRGLTQLGDRCPEVNSGSMQQCDPMKPIVQLSEGRFSH